MYSWKYQIPNQSCSLIAAHAHSMPAACMTASLSLPGLSSLQIFPFTVPDWHGASSTIALGRHACRVRRRHGRRREAYAPAATVA